MVNGEMVSQAEIGGYHSLRTDSSAHLHFSLQCVTEPRVENGHAVGNSSPNNTNRGKNLASERKEGFINAKIHLLHLNFTFNPHCLKETTRNVSVLYALVIVFQTVSQITYTPGPFSITMMKQPSLLKLKYLLGY